MNGRTRLASRCENLSTGHAGIIASHFEACPRILVQHFELGRAIDVLHLDLEKEAIEL